MIRPDAVPASILHVALVEDWATAQPAGRYEMSTRGLTLDDVGFIHGAFEHQVDAVIERFYADLDRLVVLTIDTARLRVPVVVEPAADGVDELFPHVYGAIPLDAVVDATIVTRHLPTMGP